MRRKFTCPLCEWTHEEPEVKATEDTLASVFGPGVMLATARAELMHRTEKVLKDHLGTHPLEQWVLAVTVRDVQITALETALEALGQSTPTTSSATSASTPASAGPASPSAI